MDVQCEWAPFHTPSLANHSKVICFWGLLHPASTALFLCRSRRGAPLAERYFNALSSPLSSVPSVEETRQAWHLHPSIFQNCKCSEGRIGHFYSRRGSYLKFCGRRRLLRHPDRYLNVAQLEMEEGSIHSIADMNDGLTWLPLVVNISVSPVFCAASFLLSLSSLPDTRVLCAHRRRRNGHSKVTAVLAAAIAASALSATSLNRNADDAKAEWKIITRSFVVRNANASVRDHSHRSLRKIIPYLCVDPHFCIYRQPLSLIISRSHF